MSYTHFLLVFLISVVCISFARLFICLKIFINLRNVEIRINLTFSEKPISEFMQAQRLLTVEIYTKKNIGFLAPFHKSKFIKHLNNVSMNLFFNEEFTSIIVF